MTLKPAYMQSPDYPHIIAQRRWDMFVAAYENQSIRDAGSDLFLALQEHYKDASGSLHLPTLVGALAAITGECAVTACHPELLGSTKNQMISSEPVSLLFFGNEAQLQNGIAPTLMNALLMMKEPPASLGSTHYDVAVNVSRTTAEFMGKEVPKLTLTDAADYPREWSPQACARFRGFVAQLQNTHKLDATDMCFAASFATTCAIDCAPDLGLAHTQPALRHLAIELAFGCAHMSPFQP